MTRNKERFLNEEDMSKGEYIEEITRLLTNCSIPKLKKVLNLLDGKGKTNVDLRGAQGTSMSLRFVFQGNELKLKDELSRAKTPKQQERIIFANIYNTRNMSVKFLHSFRDRNVFEIKNSEYPDRPYEHVVYKDY